MKNILICGPTTQTNLDDISENYDEMFLMLLCCKIENRSSNSVHENYRVIVSGIHLTVS